MNRSLLFLSAAVLAAIVPFACTADLDESCIGGPCAVGDPTTTRSSSSSSSSSGTGGSGGAGGSAPMCDPNKPTTGEYPCDVFNVLKTRCFECHSNPPMLGAPFSLFTYEDSQAPYANMPTWEWMKKDIESGFMPFNKPDDLQGAELKTMEDWFAKCAPPVPDGTGCEMP